MEIKITLSRKPFVFFVILATLIFGVSFAIAYGGTNPPVMGHSAGEVDLRGGVNGNARFNDKVGIGVSPVNGLLEIGNDGVVYGTMSANDYWKIFNGGAGGNNDGALIIETGDDGLEPIIFRQYRTNPPLVKDLLIIDADGDVGISNSNPTERLTVAGNILATGSICSGNNCLGPAQASYWQPSGNNIYYNDGNVGIGAAPNAPLDVQRGNGIIARFKSQNNGGDQAIQVSNGVNQIHIGSDVSVGNGMYWPYIWVGGDADPLGLVIRAATTSFTGNVGIGTTIPNDKLVVEGGNIRATGNIASGATVSGAAVSATGNIASGATVSGATVTATGANGFNGKKFVDSDGTSFFVDPNGNSVISNLDVKGEVKIEDDNYGAFKLPKSQGPNQACNAAYRGFMYIDTKNGIFDEDALCVCLRAGSITYTWFKVTGSPASNCG